MSTDCDWVVERCKEQLSKNSRAAAKAWILTARSLYPDNFAVQYEAYSLHLKCGELKEAANVLADLLSNFPQECALLDYQLDVVKVVSGCMGTDELNKFGPQDEATMKDLFGSLSPGVQKSFLLQACERLPDILMKCRIWLVTIRLFPETTRSVGLDLYDTLSQQPSTEYKLMADDPYKELLVRDVIPTLTESREIQIERPISRSDGQTVILKTSHLCQWLESVAAYFTTVTAQSQTASRDHPCAGRAGWDRLHHLFLMTADKCGWREVLLSKQIGPHLPPSLRWHGLEKISGYTNKGVAFEAPRNVAIACFYISVFMFFEMSWDYSNSVRYSGKDKQSTPAESWILIEDTSFRSHPDEKSSKRRKVEESPGVAFLDLHTGSHKTDKYIVERFLVAVDCWDFLQSNVTYRQEFSRLCQQWGVFEWEWLNSFRADMSLYKGEHNLSSQILSHECTRMKEAGKPKESYLRYLVQLVNCSVILGDTKNSCEYASEVISLIPDSRSSTTHQKPIPHPTLSSQSGSAKRKLKVLQCSTQEILPYCIQVIIRTLKEAATGHSRSDRALGHLLVLLQYDWPKEEEMFAHVITMIQKRRKFSFPEFFKYVITIDILEEMLFLYNCESLQITLLPQETNTKSRTVTRGVNRGARVDLMGAMEKQVRRCEEPIEPILRTFFKEQKLSLD
ncbi:integrator complex subunit 10-like isoform X1 [Halichondria panicea]|uniref:integrator complex subunit 10-like isoform X1 n=1 Tax=Halichondria panicea TaxID=6063 RepID=UPI00312BA02F